MPLSANFRREMLMAIKNAKKKKEGDEAQNDPTDDDASSDIVRYSSKILAKPVTSRRNLDAGQTSGGQPETADSELQDKVNQKK